MILYQNIFYSFEVLNQGQLNFSDWKSRLPQSVKVIFPEWNSYFRLKNMKFLSYPVFNWSNLTIHPYKIQFTNIKDKKNQLFLGYLDKLQTQRRTAIISFFV